MKRYFVLSAIIFILLSCDDNDNSQEPGILKVRVQNLTGYTLNQIVVNTSGGENTYPSVEPGRTSVYKEFDFAYSICSMTFRIGSETYRIQPYDYVGEMLFEEGALTYKVTLVDFNDGNFSVEGVLE